MERGGARENTVQAPVLPMHAPAVLHSRVSPIVPALHCTKKIFFAISSVSALCMHVVSLSFSFSSCIV